MPTSYDPPRKRSKQSENTPLGPQREAGFRAWAKRNRIADVDHPDSHYDYRGAYKAGVNPGPDGHWPDKYKQHGHPTFSEESQYSEGRGDGGVWRGDKFVPAKKERRGRE